MLKPVKLITVFALGLLAALASAQVFVPSANAAFTDTDGDGAIDVAEEIFGSDPNSASSTPETMSYLLHFAPPLSCSDGLDNDGDGTTDGADTGCIDSDGDSSFPDDVELRLGSDPHDDESYPEDSRLDTQLFAIGYLFSTCADGEDGDGDGLTDAADPGCAPVDADSDGFEDYVEKSLGSDWEDAASKPEHISVNPGSCTDAVDNDGDGHVDTADEGCIVAPNDDFANAIVVSTLPFTHTAKLTAATTELGERHSSCSDGFTDTELVGTVWYKYTPPSAAHVIVDATGSDLLSSVSVWRFSDAFGLAEVECGIAIPFFGLSPRFAFQAVAGEEHFIQVERYQASAVDGVELVDLGRLSLHIEETAPPPNDNFAGAQAISSLPFTASVDTIAASIQAFEPEATCQNSYAANSIWYRYTPTVDTYVLASAFPGTDFGVTVGVYEGTSLGALQQVACGNEELAFHARTGQTYYLQAAGYTCNSPSGVEGGEVASFCIDSRAGRLELRVETFTPPSCTTKQLVSNDPTGDGSPDPSQPDISSIGRAFSQDNVCITVSLARPVDPLTATGVIEFDGDSDRMTGSGSHPGSQCQTQPGLGVDAQVIATGNRGMLDTIYLYSENQTLQESVTVVFASTAITFIVPLDYIGGDNSFRSYMGVYGDAYSWDCAPNGGNITCVSGVCAFAPFRNGDANCVTGANAIDAAIVLQYGAGLLSALPCPDAADVDGDGVVDSRDAALILQYGAGLIDQLPPIPCRKPPEFC